ncbi:MAG: hypothetical protein ACFFAU_17550 [Candidatus Hodarchaeota archaeon]
MFHNAYVIPSTYPSLPLLLIVSILIIFIETPIHLYFWKDLKFAIKVTLLANLVSTLIGTSFIIYNTINGIPLQMFYHLVSAGELLITEGDMGVLVNLIYFIFFFTISLVTEISAGFFYQKPNKELLLSFTSANLVSNALFFLGFLGIGILIGVNNIEKIYFPPYFVPMGSTNFSWDFLWFPPIFILFLFLTGVILLLFLYFWPLRGKNKISTIDTNKCENCKKLIHQESSLCPYCGYHYFN